METKANYVAVGIFTLVMLLAAFGPPASLTPLIALGQE